MAVYLPHPIYVYCNKNITLIAFKIKKNRNELLFYFHLEHFQAITNLATINHFTDFLGLVFNEFGKKKCQIYNFWF